MAAGGLVWQPQVTARMQVVVEVIVLLIALLLLEAEVVRLTGIGVVVIMEDQVAVEAGVLLELTVQVMAELELVEMVMRGVLKDASQLLIQEEAVEVVVEILVLELNQMVVMEVQVLL